MSKIASILVITAMFFLSPACKKESSPLTAEELAQSEAAAVAAKRMRAEALVRSFIYLYDPLTDVCGIAFWEGWGMRETSVGGPAFSVVECTDKVRAAVANPPAAWSQPATAPPSAPPVDPSQPAEAPAAP